MALTQYGKVHFLIVVATLKQSNLQEARKAQNCRKLIFEWQTLEFGTL